jgi:regulator of protease activity HflC (stomatin/prohibitin superfamily)
MNATNSVWSIALGLLFLLIVVVGGGLGSCAAYNSVRVWNAETAGEAELAQARQNRQIATLEAEAKLESAKLLALAEIERAKGVAEANRIVADGLGGPEGYLRYLYIENLSQSQNKIIYVPTEAGLPILEAGKRPDTGQ